MNRALNIVLTGSIGMGKSTVAKMFADEGVAIWSADQVVRRLYAEDDELHRTIRNISPDLIKAGQVDFDQLRAILRETPEVLKALEAIIHPKVRENRDTFLEGQGTKLCEIPLYFEGGGEDARFDYVVVVTAPYAVQKARVLAREGMTEADFEFLLSRQVPDAEKRAKADIVIDTGKTIEETRKDVQSFLKSIGVIHA